MAQIKDEIVILKSINFSEADKILTVYGRTYGKFSILAKVIRKLTSKNRGNLQTASIAKVSFYRGSGMGVLTESELLCMPDFTLIKLKNIERVLRLTNKVIQEDQTDTKTYEALKSVIMNGFSQDAVNRYRIFLLSSNGFLPDWRMCSKCSRNNIEYKPEYFNKESFEVYCQECYNNYIKANKSTNNSKTIIVSIENNKSLITKILDNYIKEYI